MKYTKMPVDTFEKLQLNAGVVTKGFNPETGTYTSILGATTGGLTFASNPTYTDYGEDVDNCPANMKELKKLASVDPSLAGTLLTLDPETVKILVGAGDIDADDATHIIPRKDLKASDFEDIWWVGDYSDDNDDTTTTRAGYVAIHIINALNITGFQLSSQKDNKGQLAFDFHGHYEMANQDKVPYEIYVAESAAV